MSVYIIPIFILLILIFAIFKKIPIYSRFVEGAKESLSLNLSIFPYICAILIAVEIFSSSQLSVYLSKFLSPLFKIFGIPSELCQLLIIRPLSGNGSIAMLENIYATYGVDSYISRCASVIVGASETVFYVCSIYLSTTKIKKMRYTLVVSLISMFIGVVISCLLCKFI